MVAWRYVADEGVSASFVLAADEFMARRATGEPMLRLYTYRSHCALIGRFQRLDAEVDRRFCECHGIQVNRRPTGGGAILMGADQLGVAITLPGSERAQQVGGVRELFQRYSRGIVTALESLGIRASFHRKNDIEVGGRKIAGMGFYFDKRGGLLFHTSLLVDLDVPLMLRVLRTPFEKLSDKAIATVAARLTTVRREVSAPVTLDHLRQCVRQAYETTLGIETADDSFSRQELVGIRGLERERYRDPTWIDRRSFTAETFGHSRIKTPGGLLEVHLTLAGDVTTAVYLTGDFVAAERTVAELERALKRVQVSEGTLHGIVVRLAEDGYQLPGVSAPFLVKAVLAAADAARGREGATLPRGCFVATAPSG